MRAECGKISKKKGKGLSHESVRYLYTLRYAGQERCHLTTEIYFRHLKRAPYLHNAHLAVRLANVFFICFVPLNILQGDADLPRAIRFKIVKAKNG